MRRRARTCGAVLLAAVAAAGAADARERQGGLGADRLTGTAGADRLYGAEGPDRISGRGGADILGGDTGPDQVRGGPGDDVLTGAAGRDVLRGDGGADVASGGFGADVILGGEGADALEGGPDDDSIAGGPGDDLLHGGSGADLLSGGPGADRLYADTGPDKLDGGEGDDTFYVDGAGATRTQCGPGTDTVYVLVPPEAGEDYAARGTAGRRAADCERVLLTDALRDPNKGLTYLAPDAGGPRRGSPKDDTLLGGPGPDRLVAGRGNDVLWGLRQAGVTSTQPDVLDAGPGDDTVYGGPGPQTIRGGSGDDFLEGGIGRGTISGGTGADTIRLRGQGTTRVSAGSGDDTIYARGTARGVVRCGPGRDTVTVDAGDRAARDCERVQGTRAGRQAARARAAGYADDVRATAGLRHWWRLGEPEGVYGTRDEVSGTTSHHGGIGGAPGVTDDGDRALAPYEGSGLTFRPTGVEPVLDGPSTVELWARADVAGRTQWLVRNDLYGNPGERGTGIVLEADGSLRAFVRGAFPTEDDGSSEGAEVRTPPLGWSPRSWHHVALVRRAEAITLFVDGEARATAPLPAFDPGSSYGQVVFGEGPQYADLWRGALDELALYDRPLDAAQVAAHAGAGRDGVPPATTVEGLAPVITGDLLVTLSTAKGGSSFRCAVDGPRFDPCKERFFAGGLADGPHVLRVQATDRFGLVETPPREVRFVVDRSRPRTLAVVVGSRSAPFTPVAAFASDRPGATFECRVQGVGDPAYTPFFEEPGAFRPCRSPFPITRRDVTLVVRSRDTRGIADPTPVQLYVPDGARGVAGEPPAFAGARLIALAGGEPQLPERLPLRCALGTRPFASCALGSYITLPLLGPGEHRFRVRQPLPGTDVVLETPPLPLAVAPDAGPLRLAGAQFPLVVERSGQLARRAPRLRLALSAPAALTVDLVRRGGRRVTQVRTAGRTGPNVVKVPGRVLAGLRPGRYALVIAAEGGAGRAAERLPFAVVPRRR